MSKWHLLSAIQGMTIFLLLRLKSGKNHSAFPDADIALLFSLGVSILSSLISSPLSLVTFSDATTH